MGNELKRMRYFDGLFLNEDDYKLDQDYQRRIMQLHNRYMHTCGIVEGLELSPSIAKCIKANLSDVECKLVTEEGTNIFYLPDENTDSQYCKLDVTSGMALNVITDENNESTSQQIHISKDTVIDLTKTEHSTDIYLYVSHTEELCDKELIRGKDQFKHILESGIITASATKPVDENKDIVIGKVVLGQADTVETIVIGNVGDAELNKKIRSSVIEFVLDKSQASTGDIETTENASDTNNVKTFASNATTDLIADNGYIFKNEIVDKKYDEDKKIYTIIVTSDSGTTTKITSEAINDVFKEPVLTKVVTQDGNKVKTIEATIEINKDTNKPEKIIKIKECDGTKVLSETEEVIKETSTKDKNEITSIFKDGKIERVINEIQQNKVNPVTFENEIETKKTITVTEIDETILTHKAIKEEVTTINSITKETKLPGEKILKVTEGMKNIPGSVGNNVIRFTIEETSHTEEDYKNKQDTDVKCNLTQIITVSKETDDDKTVIITTEKTIDLEIDSYTGITTKKTIVYTTGQTIFDSGKVETIEPKMTTEIERYATDKKPVRFGYYYNRLNDHKTFLKEVSYIDSGKKSLRKYSGPAGTELTIGKMILKSGKNISKMPYIKTLKDALKIGLEVNSPNTNITGNVSITGDLIINGNLNDKNSNSADKELSVSNSYVQVNSKSSSNETIWKREDGGLQVYRGETLENSDACLMWSEKRNRWQVGFKYIANGEEINRDFYDIAYGDKWETLINKNNADDLHLHSKLFNSLNKAVLEATDSGDLLVSGDINLNDKTLWLRSNGNTNHGLGWFGKERKFANIAVDGPVLFGLNGGILGTTEYGQKPVITWNSLGNVGIGVKNPIDDKLELGGTLRVLSDTNPIRFTSVWTALDDPYKGSAEISNDTTNNKALVIVGNGSAGQGRKVAIWDRLDVNGQLFVKKDLQVTNAIRPSSGAGTNGIIFSSDPGGGWGDSAWLKYYARKGEACTLEIGTSNDANDNIALMASGNIGIGTLNPADKLDINGSMRVLSGTNPIRFTSDWVDSSNRNFNQAEICNDTTRYKSLMLVGNKSGSRRKVSVWDDLYVNGSLTLNGNLNTVCAIVPSVGSGPNKGISFPSEYNGDKGDSAWIRYFSDPMRGGKENMTLEIGIGDDPFPSNGNYYSGGDRIRLHASGGVFVDGYFYYSSSRDLKENITKLTNEKAKTILNGLNPVAFNFIGDTEKTTLGFIAEDVPKEVAALDQKAISPMEIVAVLTSVVKSQKKMITELQEKVDLMS